MLDSDLRYCDEVAIGENLTAIYIEPVLGRSALSKLWRSVLYVPQAGSIHAPPISSHELEL